MITKVFLIVCQYRHFSVVYLVCTVLILTLFTFKHVGVLQETIPRRRFNSAFAAKLSIVNHICFAQRIGYGYTICELYRIEIYILVNNANESLQFPHTLRLFFQPSVPKEKKP